MQDIPPKLAKKLALLDDKKRDGQILKFQYLEKLAIEEGFQSPRFWAMRMLLSDKSESDIMKRIRKKKKTGD